MFSLSKSKVCCLVSLLGVIGLVALFGRKIERAFPSLIYILPIFAYLAFAIHLLTRATKARNQGYNYLILTTLIGNLLAPLILSFALVEMPIERIHIIKYSCLSYLVFDFQNPNIRLYKRLILAFFLSGLVGVTEETAQLWIPERRFDPRDIALNIASVVFGLYYAVSVGFLALPPKFNTTNPLPSSKT